MAAIQTVEAKPPKKGPKVLAHVEIHPALGGGHNIKHVYEGYNHDPRTYEFGESEGARAAAHVARHTGLPLNGRAEEEPEEDVEAEGDEEEQTAKEKAPVKGAGSKHNNARTARTEGGVSQ